MTTIVCYKGQIAADTRASFRMRSGEVIRDDGRSLKLRMLRGHKLKYIDSKTKKEVTVKAVAGAGAGDIKLIDQLFVDMQAGETPCGLRDIIGNYPRQLGGTPPNVTALFLLDDGDCAHYKWANGNTIHTAELTVVDKSDLVVIGSGVPIVRMLHQIVPNLNAVDYVALARAFDKSTGGIIEYYSLDASTIGSYRKMSETEIKYVLDALKDKLENPELPLGR